jgi:PTH1 family peptidyl-tRNA hydrolase
MLLIVGLGNPGKEYQNTYHNCGFLTVDALAEKLDVTVKKSECHALTAHAHVDGEKVILAKPQTFMNLSGKSVWGLTTKYKISKDDLIVVYDDIDITPGSLRLREEGGPGTHNGMRDIVARVNTNEFKRVRIGIGQPPNSAMSLADFVTSQMSALDKRILQDTFEKGADALYEFIKGETFQNVMQKYNK